MLDHVHKPDKWNRMYIAASLEQAVEEHTRLHPDEPVGDITVVQGKKYVRVWIPITGIIRDGKVIQGERGNAMILFVLMLAVLAAIVVFGFPGAGW